MSARRYFLAAAMSASAGLLSFTDASYAAGPIAKYAFSASHERGYPVERSLCRCAPLPRPGLQPDYQFYYNTPGYFPGFYPVFRLGFLGRPIWHPLRSGRGMADVGLIASSPWGAISPASHRDGGCCRLWLPTG